MHAGDGRHVLRMPAVKHMAHVDLHLRREQIMGKFLAAGLVLWLAAILAAPAMAQIQLDRSVNGAGGAFVNNDGGRLGCTLGQAVAGFVTDAHYIHGIGFWYQTGHPSSDVVEPLPDKPTAFALRLRSLTPGGSLATIAYAVPVPTQVSIRIFDITGREVSTLATGWAEPGYHEAPLRVQGLAGGIYFCRMDAKGFSATRKLVLVK
jgi:hypothetical protein